VYAAAVLLTVIDVHPYADGNGRLSRIGLNWALAAKGACPFVVHLFSTPTQRQAYVDAIKKTRRNCDLQAFGTAGTDAVGKVHQNSGCLFPMVDLILDRLHKAVIECTRLLNDKTSQKQQDEEEQAARRFRERSAAGTCLICFEDHPNIATLCCGKAAHLNCMAEWLSSNASCPQCRAILPSLPERMRPTDEDGDDTTTDYIAETESTDYTANFDDTTIEMEDENDNTAAEGQLAVRVRFGDVTVMGPDDDLDDDDEGANGTREMEEDDDTTTTDDAGLDITDDPDQDEDALIVAAVANHLQQQQSESPPSCTFCTNLSARGCANACCGRCCIAHGHYHCVRHSS
jgi:Fic/DOC family